MITRLKFSASLAALAFVAAGAMSQAKAADVVQQEGCNLSGSVAIGYLYDWQNISLDNSGGEDADIDYSTPFGEAGGLVTCNEFNAQLDFAYYDHTGNIDNKGSSSIDFNNSGSHFGGAVFWRDPTWAAAGISASVVGLDTGGFFQSSIYRAGVFGEWYAGDTFTLGAAAHYVNGDLIDNDLNLEGADLTAYIRWYASPDFSFLAQVDGLLSTIDLGPKDADLTGFAITGEAEYLVWDKGLSIFGGARYADRTLDFGNSGNETFDIEDFEVYAGLKVYFGTDGTLVERQRNGLVDNTSTMLEKLPQFED